MSRKSIYYLGIVGLFILLVHPFALAQLSRATISGTVTDETGGVLPGVSVTIENLEMGTTRETVADDEGKYFAPNLLVGAYSVRAELPGFSTAVRTGIQLTVARNAIVDLTLQVGEMTQEVTVTGEAPLVETTSSTVGGLVEQDIIEELPLNGRSFDDIEQRIERHRFVQHVRHDEVHADRRIAGRRSVNRYIVFGSDDDKRFLRMGGRFRDGLAQFVVQRGGRERLRSVQPVERR